MSGNPNTSPPEPADLRDPVEELRPYIGQWVAVRDDRVLIAAASATEVIEWLRDHGERADSIFRVPEDEAAVGGPGA